ncbi:MAG: ribbon-helix-helix protein, CopG family [Gemmatimonadetes bacterium]|nr:ribbon-helix-helix protein, CopG family [Gemmatimonadota bacterium]
MALARISITVPKGLVAAADRQARELGRSRSWVVAEALRAYLSGAAGAARAREPALVPYATLPKPGLGEQRLGQLEADLRLSPEERVLAAEDTARAVPGARTRPRYRQVLQFDRFEDFLAWKRHADLAP